MNSRLLLTLGLVTLVLMPTAAPQAASESVVLVEDAHDDVVKPVGIPSQDAHPFGVLDIRRLALVRETEETLEFALALGTLSTSPGAGPYQQELYGRIFVNFTVVDVPVSMALNLTMMWSPLQTSPGFQTRLDSVQEVCGRQCARLGALLDDEEDTVWVPLEKKSLSIALQGFGTLSDAEPALRVDDVLTGFHVESFLGSADREVPAIPADNPWNLLPWQSVVRDEADGESATYKVSSVPPPLSTKVLVQGMPDSLPPVPVLLGTTMPVTFAVANLGTQKQVFALDYTVNPRVGGDATSVEGVRATGPVSIALPAGMWRNYTLNVAMPPAEEFQSSGVRIDVRASISGTSEESTGRIFLRPGVELGPGRDRLYLQGFPDGTSADDDAVRNAYNTVSGAASPTPSSGRPGLSLQREDPEAIPGYWLDAMPGSLRGALMDKALAVPVAFAPGGSVRAELRVKASPLPADVKAAFEFRQGLEVIAAASTTLSLGTDEQTIVVSAPVALDGDVLLPGGFPLGVRVKFDLADPVRDPPAGPVRERIMIKSQDSVIVLPLVELPAIYRNAVDGGPFQIQLAGEAEAFVNPGKSRVFNLTVTNGDVEFQRLRLKATSTSANWTMDFLPGATFDLPGSEAVRVGLRVGAPAQAKDGDRLDVNVTAVADDETESVRLVRLTVVESMDVPDDGDSYVAAAEDVSRLAPTGKDTPGPNVAALLLLGLGVAAVGRRRQS